VWDGMDSSFGTAAVKLQKGRVRRLGRGVLGPGVRIWRVIAQLQSLAREDPLGGIRLRLLLSHTCWCQRLPNLSITSSKHFKVRCKELDSATISTPSFQSSRISSNG
jgi:hypothetical protein